MTVHWGPNAASGMGEGLGGTGAEGAGYGTLGWIAAAIAGQHLASDDQERVFEGQKSDDVFSGNFFTEPWYALLTEKLFGANDDSVTSGEKLDASIENEDWSTALKRLPAAGNYWADPGGQVLGYELWKNIFGDDVAGILNPIAWIVNNLEDLF